MSAYKRHADELNGPRSAKLLRVESLEQRIEVSNYVLDTEQSLALTIKAREWSAF